MNRSIKTALIIAGVALALLVGVPWLWGGLGGGQGAGWGMMGPGMMGGFGWGWSGPIFMLVFWGLIIWGVAAVAGGIGQPSSGNSSGRPDSPLEVLKKRYARGEISKEEYEEMRKALA